MEKGALGVGRAPNIYSMFDYRWARQMHRDRWHVHGRSQDGTVLSGVHILFLPTSIYVKHNVVR